jgi:hypothetical protein
MKKYIFYLHYNKPASIKRGKPVISIHYRKQCLLVENFRFSGEIEGKINSRQPKFVIKGLASSITIENNIAIIR